MCLQVFPNIPAPQQNLLGREMREWQGGRDGGGRGGRYRRRTMKRKRSLISSHMLSGPIPNDLVGKMSILSQILRIASKQSAALWRLKNQIMIIKEMFCDALSRQIKGLMNLSVEIWLHLQKNKCPFIGERGNP